MSRFTSPLVAVLLCTVLLIGPGGCARSGSQASHSSPHSGTESSGPVADTASASVGDISITGGYVPQPASPDVAAAYLTVHNNGSTPDTMDAVTTNVTSHVMAMTETDSDGVGTMTDVGKVVIAPHSSMLFTPGHRHLMLQSPTRMLKQGQEVTVRITFAKAGTVTLTLPVVPTTGPTPAGSVVRSHPLRR